MARFKIKRHPIGVNVRAPWVLRDRNRPAFVGQYPTLARAVTAADNIVRTELGMPQRLTISKADIIATMEATA